jgi:mannose-1-phosphate guanylyltransferase
MQPRSPESHRLLVDAPRRNIAAVVLAGGRGTRLLPLTETTPKALVPLLDRPQLAYSLDYLLQNSIERAVLACGHLAATVRDRFGSRFGRLSIDYVVEPEPLGTGGAIALAARNFEETFLALNGDSLRSASISSLMAFHRARAASATMLLAPVQDVSGYGSVAVDRHGRVREFIEKPARPARHSGGLINAGVYVLEPDVFVGSAPGRPVSLERDVFPQLAEQGRLYGAELPGMLIDMGTPAGYLEAHSQILRTRPGRQVHPDAHVDVGAQLVPPVLIGPLAEVAAGARIGPFASVGCCATVGSDAEVRSAAVLPRATVSPHARVHRTIVAPGLEPISGREPPDD